MIKLNFTTCRATDPDLNLLAQGYLCKEVSVEFGISSHTVDTYRRRIYEKLHVHSRAQATALYNQLKPASLEEPKAI
jgi:DNA-binding CsgD family transcriptional regulator